jgi:hypothetical protein
LLGEFFARSIAWQDYRGTPISEKKRLVKGNTFPRVEGQVMRPGGTYFFDLERSSATYALLQSLLLFSRSPSRTWAFPHGELHKRELSRWLRKNAAKVVASIQPDPPTLAQDVLRSAVEALALATMLRDRRKLPDGRAERICSLLAPIWETSSRPVVVSSELQSVADDLEQKHAGLRDLVVQELGCGQGDASPKDFLDPVPLLTSLDKFAAEFQFHSAPSACDQNYWKPRFLGASTLAKEGFAALPKRIEKEREAIGKLAQAAAAFVKNTGIDDRDRRDDLEKCLEKLIEVINLQRGTQHKKPILSLPNEPFDQLWQRKLVQTSDTRAAWANAIARAVELAKEKNLASLLAYNPVRLQEAIDALSVIEVHLDLIHEHLSDEENQGGADGDSRPKLLAALREIEQLADTKESQTR